MSLASERKEVYLQERKNREEGILNGIPLYYTFPKLGSIIRTIPKGYPILWTANSGVGKTQSWMAIIIYTLYKLWKEHPELSTNIKVVVALLEDTEKMFIDRLYSLLFFELFQIVIEADDLHARKPELLPSDVIKRYDDVGKEVDFILDKCEIIDSVYNPTGLYKWARTISNKYGEHKEKKVTFTDEFGKQEEKSIYSHYVPYDENMQVLMIVDNLNNLSNEMMEGRMLDDRQTINLWTRRYCRLQITKHWNWSIINILQQASDSEKPQFDYKGNSIVDKLKPSLDGLGNSKECQRDHFLIVGLFAPARYGVERYNKFDITKYGDNFRSLTILKSNLSPTNIEIPFYFNGACSLMRELPIPGGIIDTTYEEITQQLYDKR